VYHPAVSPQPGDPVAATWTPGKRTTAVFAELSGDFNPVHLDDEHARAAGFDGVIVHGMCVLGASARAAHFLAPDGSVLQGLDVRFARPVLPEQPVEFDGQAKEKGEQVKVSLSAAIAGARVMSPANFTFGEPAKTPSLPSSVELERESEDVVGDVFRFTGGQIDAYRAITEPKGYAPPEDVPPMTCLLGLTGALEKAFKAMQPPEQPGTWVHLRQSGVFYLPVEANRDYVCRVQAGRRIVRPSKIGVMVTIPFLVERYPEADLVSTGACVLLYAFDREDG